MLDRQNTARGAELDSAQAGGVLAGVQSSGRGHGSARGELVHDGGENNPAARHEEARMRFEQDVASKLMRVIEKKKLEDLKVWCKRCSSIEPSTRVP